MNTNEDVFHMISELDTYEVLDVCEEVDPEGWQRYASDPWDALVSIAQVNPEIVVKAILEGL